MSLLSDAVSLSLGERFSKSACSCCCDARAAAIKTGFINCEEREAAAAAVDDERDACDDELVVVSDVANWICGLFGVESDTTVVAHLLTV